MITKKVKGRIIELYANTDEPNNPCRIKLNTMPDVYIGFWNLRNGEQLKDIVSRDFSIGDNIEVEYYEKGKFKNGTKITCLSNDVNQTELDLNIKSVNDDVIDKLSRVEQELDEVLNVLLELKVKIEVVKKHIGALKNEKY